MQPNDGIIAVWDRSGATRTLRAAQLSGFTFTPTYTVTRLDRNSAMIGAAGGRVLLVMDEFANVPPRVLVSANTSAALTQATVKGSVQVGKTVRCASGFGVEATSRSYRWKRDGNDDSRSKGGRLHADDSRPRPPAQLPVNRRQHRWGHGTPQPCSLDWLTEAA